MAQGYPSLKRRDLLRVHRAPRQVTRLADNEPMWNWFHGSVWDRRRELEKSHPPPNARKWRGTELDEKDP
jgi:hypothetical protein